ncbi:MAG: hypothetical protein ACLPY2_13455 [Bryobacteraceae bacterium]|jgi:hypothetical protein
MTAIPYNRPHLTGDELRLIEEAVLNLQLSANGEFTRRCQSWLEERLGRRCIWAKCFCRPLPHAITPELPWDLADWPRFLANHPLLTQIEVLPEAANLDAARTIARATST